MNAGTIFVLCLAAAFLIFVIYLSRLSRAAKREQPVIRPGEAQKPSDRSENIPPLKRAG